MKTRTRSLIITAMAFLLPISALKAADACCAKDTEKADAGCCSTEAVASMNSAFAAPPSAPLTAALLEADAAFLARYEHVHAALAADDFKAAQKAATGLDGAEGIASAESLAKARVAFKALSLKAIEIAKGHEGFYVAHCPMVKGGGADWLQTSKKISNPYFGSQMLTCGTIKG